MKVVCHSEQRLHYPAHFLVNGVFQPNPEMPERQDRLLQAALDAGCRYEAPLAHGMEPIAAIHTDAYLHFLERAWERWSRIEGAAPAVTPNIHPDRRDCGYPASVVAQAGYHMPDASAPLARYSARDAASTASAEPARRSRAVSRSLAWPLGSRGGAADDKQGTAPVSPGRACSTYFAAK